MPVHSPTYKKRPWFLFNRHLETVIPFVTDKPADDLYERERLDLPDGDFLDLDWIKNQSKTLIVLSHGIEGNTQSYYVKRAARHFSNLGHDILAWNFRSCSKELNVTSKLYHSGDTDDLRSVIEYAHSRNDYQRIILVGYSMGGTMTLNYLGEKSHPESIQGAITFSVPCSFLDSLEASERLGNRIYVNKILEKLKRKLKAKLEAGSLYPGIVDIDKIDSIRDFTERVLLPLYGYQNIETFDQMASCIRRLKNIEVPVFMGNAKNDPLLGDKSYPVGIAQSQSNIHLEIPRFGGHLGFTSPFGASNWMELSSNLFINQYL